ncbi:MAG: hypothetical protein FWD97_09030 [Defluviitaleaceae bacterium]|nr:hypothetical protein [Defluviitaleaceae bacterium]
MVVETQYKYLLESMNNPNIVASKNQDIKVSQLGDAGVNDENGRNDGNSRNIRNGMSNGSNGSTKSNHDQVFIEFQNSPSTTPFISDRSLQYFGLGIGHNQDYKADQIWLLAQSNEKVDEKLLDGEIFSNFTMKNEKNNIHHNSSSITYINLSKLSRQSNKAGQLAAVLLGREISTTYPEVERIAKGFKDAFGAFKIEKEAPRMMTFAERYIQKDVDEAMYQMEKDVQDTRHSAAEILSESLGIALDKALEMIKQRIDTTKKEGVSHEAQNRASSMDDLIHNAIKVDMANADKLSKDPADPKRPRL